jgi:hypothetical protein
VYTNKKLLLKGKVTVEIREVTSDELLTKQAMRKKKIIIYKRMHTYLSYFSMYTSGTEASVILGNKFLYDCVKEVCHL